MVAVICSQMVVTPEVSRERGLHSARCRGVLTEGDQMGLVGEEAGGGQEKGVNVKDVFGE